MEISDLGKKDQDAIRGLITGIYSRNEKIANAIDDALETAKNRKEFIRIAKSNMEDICSCSTSAVCHSALAVKRIITTRFEKNGVNERGKDE